MFWPQPRGIPAFIACTQISVAFEKFKSWQLFLLRPRAFNSSLRHCPCKYKAERIGRRLEKSIWFFLHNVPSKLSAIVKGVNLFQRILNSVCIFQENVNSILSYTENTPKLLNLHQNSLSAHGDYGMLGFFLSIYYLSIYLLVSEYARSIQTYSENIWFFLHNVPSKLSAIVKGVNLFQRILNSVCIFQENVMLGFFFIYLLSIYLSTRLRIR